MIFVPNLPHFDTKVNFQHSHLFALYSLFMLRRIFVSDANRGENFVKQFAGTNCGFNHLVEIGTLAFN